MWLVWLRSGKLHEGRTSGLDLERGMGVFLMKGSGEDIPEFLWERQRHLNKHRM